MEITKIGKFTAEEKEAIVKAGKIIGELNKALSAKEIDLLDQGTSELLAALSKVVSQTLEQK